MFIPTNLEHLRQLKTEQIISLYLGKEITGDFISYWLLKTLEK